MSESDYIDDWGGRLADIDFGDTGKVPKDTHKPFRFVNGVKLYRCTKCGQYKPKSEYYKDKRNPCGVRNRCKKCYHKRRKQ